MIYIQPTSDIFIKYLFGTEEDSPLLKDFINTTQKNAGLPLIENLEVKNPFNLKNFHFDKESVLDIKALSETDEIFNIEVQTSGNDIFKNRSLYYWARLYASQLEQGSKYDRLNPVICINILDFNLFAEEVSHPLCFMLRDLQEPKFMLTDHLATQIQRLILQRSYFIIHTSFSWPPARYQMQGGKEQALRRIRHTPQGDAAAANAAGGILMVDQGQFISLNFSDFLIIISTVSLKNGCTT